MYFLMPIMRHKRQANTKKKKSAAKLIDIKESPELCNIWRVSYLKKKRFTFRQIHNSVFIQGRLHSFLVSNILQESIKKSIY